MLIFFFFSIFSQEFAISILANLNVISDVFGTTNSGDVRVISSTLQNFLICIEMFLAAIAHHYFFTYKDYVLYITFYITATALYSLFIIQITVQC